MEDSLVQAIDSRQGRELGPLVQKLLKPIEALLLEYRPILAVDILP
jgi:hypothetical protein